MTSVTSDQFVEKVNEVLKIPDSEKLTANLVKYTRRLNASKLLVVFTSDVPTQIFKNIKNSERKLFASDFLTKTRDTILHNLRKMRDEPDSPITLVTSRRGRPAFKVKDDDSFYFVETVGRYNELFVENG